MDQAEEQRMAPLIAALRQDPGGGSDLPDPAGAIVRAALTGQTVYQIAQEQEMSEEAVWRALSDAARAAAGTAAPRPVETGGMGSDTDPGVTGGYGETGFGSLGLEPPIPVPEEPPGPTVPDEC
jgi:hypothetical protein